MGPVGPPGQEGDKVNIFCFISTYEIIHAKVSCYFYRIVFISTNQTVCRVITTFYFEILM